MKAGPGFTIVEVLLAMAIFAIISAFTTINLIKPQTKASVETTATTLVSDLRQQQLKAMVGDGENQTSASEYGIRFEADKYILFRGSTYSGADPNNYQVLTGSNVTLSNNLPPASLSSNVFSKRSGEVSGYVSGSDTITITNTSSGEQKILTVNRYGAITIN